MSEIRGSTDILERSTTQRAMVLAASAALLFTLVDAAVKYVSDRVHVGHILFVFGAVGLGPVVIYSRLIKEKIRIPKAQRMIWHITRSIMLIACLYMYYLSYTVYSLFDIATIWLVGPVIAVVLAHLFLKESVSPFQWLSLAIGAFVFAIIANPGRTGNVFAAVFILAGTLIYACVLVLNRVLSQKDGVISVLFWFHCFLALASSPFLFMRNDTILLSDICLVVLVGVLQCIGQICLIMSYRLSQVKVVAPIEYTSILWAVPIGWVVFGELPLLISCVTAIVVIVVNYYSVIQRR